MICNHAITQIWRTWSRNLVTPPKDFLIGRVNNIHSLGALWTCVKLIWRQKQTQGIFLCFFLTDGCLVHHKNLDLYLISYGKSVDFVGFVTRPRHIREATLGLDIRVFPSRSKDNFFLNQRILYFFVIFVAFCWYKLRCRYVRDFFFFVLQPSFSADFINFSSVY